LRERDGRRAFGGPCIAREARGGRRHPVLHAFHHRIPGIAGRTLSGPLGLSVPALGTAKHDLPVFGTAYGHGLPPLTKAFTSCRKCTVTASKPISRMAPKPLSRGMT